MGDGAREEQDREKGDRRDEKAAHGRFLREWFRAGGCLRLWTLRVPRTNCAGKPRSVTVIREVNDRSGRLFIQDSVLRRNPSHGFETRGYPGIFVQAMGDPVVVNSVIE